MDLKDYREQPDNGLFENILRRVRRRRLMRIGGAAVGVVAVAAVLCVALWPASNADTDTQQAGPQVALQLPPQDAAPTTDATCGQPVAETQGTMGATTGNEGIPVTKGLPLQTRSQVAEVKTAEGEADLTALVPAFTHRTADLSLPTTPQQDLRRGCINDGSAIVESENVESSNNSHPLATQLSPEAEKSSEQPLHEDNLFWAPNIIVPSGDVDANRTFTMKFTSTVSHFQIFIYNRGGRQVFHSTDPAFSWDGTYKGSALSQGAYIWVMKFRDSDGKPHEERGSVTLIR